MDEVLIQARKKGVLALHGRGSLGADEQAAEHAKGSIVLAPVAVDVELPDRRFLA